MYTILRGEFEQSSLITFSLSVKDGKGVVQSGTCNR
jgi:hypothetical protein